MYAQGAPASSESFNAVSNLTPCCPCRAGPGVSPAVRRPAAAVMRPQVLIQLYGATATRLLSNFQLVVVWVLAVALFYAFDSHPLLHGIGAPPCAV